MKHLKNTTLLATVIVAPFYLLLIDASSFTITDDRVRTLETSPALGRGYSVGTNSYHSNCLMADESTTPSYNYDYIFADMTQSTDIESELTGKLSSSFSYAEVKTEAAAVEVISKSESDSELFLVVGTMRIDRYFSGLKMETSPITADAKNLLTKQDYIGFFNSCGTNYVRSIRRAQEITAIFKFNSQSRDLAQEFAAGIKVQGGTSATDESIFDEKRFSYIKESLEIKVLAYGLGLNTKGESMIVSTSIESYNKVVEFAFRSFTQTVDSSNVGMVYALEFVPWVDNPSFQHESKILDVDIELPLPRSLIPKAIADTAGLLFENNNSMRSQFSCKHLYFSIDKYGYCCDTVFLFNQEKGRYETEEVDVELSSRICKPNRKLEKSLIKNNISNNGEFVARLDSAVQKKINQLFTLEKCVASVNSMQERFGSYVLKSQGSVKYNSSLEGKVTVNHLKIALDPLGDLSLIRHMGNELDEFVDMYYRPCIAALFGTNIGSSPDVEAKYFMAQGWLTHEVCSKLSCLADNMRWNRNGSGCIESLITGSKAPTYDPNDNKCKKGDGVELSEETRYDLIVESELISTRPLTNIAHPPTDYILQFTIEPLGTISSTGCILLFTDDVSKTSSTYGYRLPGVFFLGGTTQLLIQTGTDDDPNGGSVLNLDELPVNTETIVRIEVLGTIRKLFFDNVEVLKDEIGTRSQVQAVRVFLGNPRPYGSYGIANANISNMFFTSNSDRPEQEACEYKSTDLRMYQTRLNFCWGNPNSATRIPHYMMEHFCMPEIIGEKLDEEVVHPCEKIGFTNRSLKLVSNQNCLHNEDLTATSADSDHLFLNTPCSNDNPSQYFSLDSATGEFKAEGGSYAQKCLTNDNGPKFQDCTKADNQLFVLRTNGEITSADHVTCLYADTTGLSRTLFFEACDKKIYFMNKAYFEFSLLDFVATPADRRLQGAPTTQSIKPDDVSTGAMPEITLEESVSKITHKQFLRKNPTEQSLKPDDVNNGRSATEIVPLEKIVVPLETSASKTSEEFDDQSIKSDDISTGTIP